MWEQKKIGDFLKLEYGKPLDKSKRKEDGLYPAYGANGVKCRSDEFYFDNKTIIVGRKGSAGEITLTEKKFWPLDVTYFVTFDRSKYDLMFVYHLLSRLDLPSLATGVKPGINRNNVYAIQVHVPGLAEQKRIVAILDQAFADIEQARVKTEQNLKNAHELYLSKKNTIFINLQASSKLMPLPSVCDNIFAGGDAPKTGLYSKTKTDQFQIPIYANAVKNKGLYGFTDHTRADKPSVSIAARGSGTGHIELRHEAFLPIVRLIVLTPDQEIINLEYLKHALQNLDILRSGSAIPQLTVPMVKGYSIPIPSLNDQQELTEELIEVERFINQVKKIYLNKIELLDELKKSILHLAFSGKLTKSIENNKRKGATA